MVLVKITTESSDVKMKAWFERVDKAKSLEPLIYSALWQKKMQFSK